MDNDVRVWVDGALVDPQAPTVRALDHGVTVGDGAFETAKIDRGVVFAATRHLRRLDRTLAGLGLPPADHDAIAAGIEAVLAAGRPIEFGRLRYTVTGGMGPLGSDRSDAPATYIVLAAEQPHPPASAGVALVPWTRNERSAVAGLKTTSYAENVVALRRAQELGAIEALVTNTAGLLCEGTGSNVFLIEGERVVTPDLASGCLAGITRELVIEWGREAGFDVVEEPIEVDRLLSADEVFITSSTKDVLPVDTVLDARTDEVTTRTVAPGPVTAELAGTFARFAAERNDP